MDLWFAHVLLYPTLKLPIDSLTSATLLSAQTQLLDIKMPTREIVPIFDNPDLFGNSLNFEMNESLIQMNESFTSNESLQPAETNESSVGSSDNNNSKKQPADAKGKVVVKRKKRGKYNSYKSEEGQRRVKHAIETFLERRRQNGGKASLRAFAAEVDIKYETLKPYCREDESKRKKFVFVGQAKLVSDAQMEAFCKRMIVEQPDLDRTKIIDAFLTQFHNLQFDYKAACNQYDRIIKKKCNAMKNDVTSFLNDAQPDSLRNDNTLAAASLASLNGPPTTVADEPTYQPQPVAALQSYPQPVAALPMYPQPVAALPMYPQPVAAFLQWPAESELAALPDVDVDEDVASSIYTEYI